MHMSFIFFVAVALFGIRAKGFNLQKRTPSILAMAVNNDDTQPYDPSKMALQIRYCGG